MHVINKIPNKIEWRSGFDPACGFDSHSCQFIVFSLSYLRIWRVWQAVGLRLSVALILCAHVSREFVLTKSFGELYCLGSVTWNWTRTWYETFKGPRCCYESILQVNLHSVTIWNRHLLSHCGMIFEQASGNRAGRISRWSWVSDMVNFKKYYLCA